MMGEGVFATSTRAAAEGSSRRPSSGRRKRFLKGAATSLRSLRLCRSAAQRLQQSCRTIPLADQFRLCWYACCCTRSHVATHSSLRSIVLSGASYASLANLSASLLASEALKRRRERPGQAIRQRLLLSPRLHL